MIKPTVGRVVNYFPRGNAEGPPLAAIIACVWSDTCVNLAIFNASGTPMSDPPTLVLLVQEGNPRPTGGNFCEWMPYQVGQAKSMQKTESGPLETSTGNATIVAEVISGVPPVKDAPSASE